MTAREDATAEAGLRRLLLALPSATRQGGVDVRELAQQLDVEPKRILKDLQEVESRTYQHHAGLGDQIQLALTSERLEVWTTGEFQRPVRLTPREALALELALRVELGAGGGEGESASSAHAADPARRQAFHVLRQRLVDALRAAPSPQDPAPEDSGMDVALEPEADDDPLRLRAREAVLEGKELRMVYRAPGRDAKERTIAPLVLAHAEGRWYLLARDHERGGQRAFRLDRVLEAEETGRDFTPDPEDDAAVERFFQDGRVLHDRHHSGAEAFDAVVDYSPGIARWIREQQWERTEELDEGGLRVRHRVADPEWLLRHVLSYGPDAEIVEPRWMRRRVAEAMTALLGERAAGGVGTPGAR